ncbi:MAG: hypothetical protein IJN60_00915 [Oscillospiraceae bacterium]|nr:hypothetical protein [Oscillospiraceae bacterium]
MAVDICCGTCSRVSCSAGNVTGGGVFDSKTECNPTPYPQVSYAALS